MSVKEILTNRDDWKLKFHMEDCLSPRGMRHLRFTGEQYNKEGEMTNTSSYDFFLEETEVFRLANYLLK
jgi:hypothetical protein